MKHLLEDFLKGLGEGCTRREVEQHEVKDMSGGGCIHIGENSNSGLRLIGRSKCDDALRVVTGTALTWESGS